MGAAFWQGRFARELGGKVEALYVIGDSGQPGTTTETVENGRRVALEILHSIEIGTYVKLTKLTLGEFLEQWLQSYVATKTAPRTAERYAEIVRLHLTPSLGSLPLSALQPQHIQRYYANALESGRRDGNGGLSARTVHHHHRVLYEALKHAVKHGIIARNPTEAVDPPRPHNKEVTIIGPSDVRLLLDTAEGTPYYAAFYTAIYSGLCRGELLGLRWCDIDLDFATLSVVQTLRQFHNSQYIFKEPKSKRGSRQIALSPSLATLLRKHKARQEDMRRLLGKPLGPADLVFSHPDGTPLRPDSVTRAFRTIARSVGLGGVRLHDLRHAHATLMLRQGVHPKIVSERLGHTSIAITIDTYSHVLPGLQEAAARRFEEGLQDIPVDVIATAG